MSNTQRPTPETDEAEINLGSACGQFSEWYVKPDFARKLERERDEAFEQIQMMLKHDANRLERDSIVGSCDCLTKTPEVKYHKPGCKYRLISERDEAREELENLKASGIHSCHDACKRPLCVANRKIKAMRDELQKVCQQRDAWATRCDKLGVTAMREAIKDIYLLTEGYADGAPDASAHDKLCNEIATKLQPFLKP